jgi:hypothetical protein
LDLGEPFVNLDRVVAIPHHCESGFVGYASHVGHHVLGSCLELISAQARKS